MMIIALLSTTGSFAENKDLAKDIRQNHIVPALNNDQEVVLDFDGIDATTQSFIHALISDIIKKYGNNVLDRIYFKNCNTTVQKIINIVVSYVQEAG